MPNFPSQQYGLQSTENLATLFNPANTMQNLKNREQYQAIQQAKAEQQAKELAWQQSGQNLPAFTQQQAKLSPENALKAQTEKAAVAKELDKLIAMTGGSLNSVKIAMVKAKQSGLFDDSEIQKTFQQYSQLPSDAERTNHATASVADFDKWLALQSKPDAKTPDWQNPDFQKYEQEKARFAAGLKQQGGTEPQRGQIVFDNQGRAFNVNPYTNKVNPIAFNGQQISGAQYSTDLQGNIAGAKASGKETGQATGEAVASLQNMEAMMPRLEGVVSELSNLGKKATYTIVGQGVNSARRQMGMSVGEGAVARKEYISKVDNEILPLLRQTFGAQFTQKEGESLKSTLGDPNATPEEKDAVLKSFIETKYGQIAGLHRRTQPSAPAAPEQAIRMLKANPSLAPKFKEKYGYLPN